MKKLKKQLRRRKDSKQLTQKFKLIDVDPSPKPTKTKNDTSSETSRKSGEIVCPNDKCGKTISNPLKLTDLSSKQSWAYLACPHCMSRLGTTTAKQKDSAERNPFKSLGGRASKKTDPEEKKDTGKCNQYFGYLREHPKYVPIPDECLTCPKATKCLLG
ncbi:MAG: hypothetical protein JSV57_05895 [Candidatus Bathyarchaeota archaeon]|nr:MAG: hypothetical protein JSV57_05895 [Candidatus Bathyarchaeota archaeon]